MGQAMVGMRIENHQLMLLPQIACLTLIFQYFLSRLKDQ
jgi:hypothetical protein